MKAILEFELPMEQESHENALKGVDYKIVIQDIDNHLRDMIKHQDLPTEVYNTVYSIRDKLTQLCEDHGVTLWT